MVRYWHWFISALQVAVIWWPLTPIWATPIVVALTDATPWLIPVVAVATIIGVLTTPSSRLLGRSCADRTWQWWQIHVWWPDWATNAKLEGPPVLDEVHRSDRARSPAVVEFVFWPDQSGLTRPKLQDAIDALRGRLHYADGLHRTTSDGRVSFTVARDPLPHLAAGPMDWFARPAPGVMPLGVGHRGELCWHYELPTATHLLVAGMSGSGKGGLLSQVCYRGLALGWRVLSINPKNSPELDDADDVIMEVNTAAGIEAIIRMVEDERAARQTELRARSRVEREAGRPALTDYRSYLRATGKPLGTPIVVLVDEVADVVPIGDCLDLLMGLAAKARSVGIHLVLATQHAVADVFGRQQGSRLKANFGVRVVLPTPEETSFHMMLAGHTSAQQDRLMEEPRTGHALVQGLDPSDLRPVRGQLYWNDGDVLARATVARYERDHADLVASLLSEADLLAEVAV